MPKLAGPLVVAVADMESEVREAIAQRAKQPASHAVTHEADGIALAGSVLIGSGHKPEG
ncbi:MAG: hypothetical protein ACRDNK_10880 [Solirubrobacteraceae bacterium]